MNIDRTAVRLPQLLLTIFLGAFLLPISTSAARKRFEHSGDSSSRSLKVVHVNGVDLHYLSEGSGTAVVFVHGGLADYRLWQGQIGPFSKYFRVISYSRRYNFPNHNPPIEDYSALVDAEDLAGFIRALHLGRVHVIGESYGAYAAMLLAIHHPDLVKSLVLSEPAALGWLQDSAKGKKLWDDFQQKLWLPIKEALKVDDRTRALQLVETFFANSATPGQLPPGEREQVLQNLLEWTVLTASPQPFPSMSRTEVQSISVPTLMLSGTNTIQIHKLIDEEISSALPHNKRIFVPQAGHEMWDEQPELCRRATIQFLGSGGGAL